MLQAKVKWQYYAITCVIVMAPLCLTIWQVFERFDVIFEKTVIKYGLSVMPESGRQEVYQLLAEQFPGMYDSIPEPLVGSILQKNTVKKHAGASIYANNAGMRSVQPYVPKKTNAYRIVCLGDSIAFGMGGREEDRFGNQIEEILKELKVTVDGKEVEVYTVGLPGWNALTEATYLSSRISEYNPDLTLVLMCTNDLNDAFGIRGFGELTSTFSPQCRMYGSGVVAHDWPMHLLKTSKEIPNVLLFDLGPESRTRWEETFDAFRRLETLLEKRSGKMIFGVLYQVPFRSPNTPFRELCISFYQRSDMKSPFIFTDFFENHLPHDFHPDRKGHRILASHYLHTLAQLGWLPIDRADLPPLDTRLDTVTEHIANENIIQQKKDHYVRKLPDKIAFDSLNERNALAILGGVYRGRHDEPLTRYPDGSPKSVFVLRRKREAEKVALEIEVPKRIELYPFKLEMRLNGQSVTAITLHDEQDAGRHLLEGEIPESDEFSSTVEVTLVTGSYWTRINDATMRSYKLISARQI